MRKRRIPPDTPKPDSLGMVGHGSRRQALNHDVSSRAAHVLTLCSPAHGPVVCRAAVATSDSNRLADSVPKRLELAHQLGVYHSLATAPAGELAAAEMLAQLLTPILGLLALSGFELGQDAVRNGRQLCTCHGAVRVKATVRVAGK